MPSNGLGESLVRVRLSGPLMAGCRENESTDSARGGNIGLSMVMVVCSRLNRLSTAGRQRDGTGTGRVETRREACATAFTRRLLYRHKVSLAVPWHSRHSEPVAAHGMGAVRFQRDHEPGKARARLSRMKHNPRQGTASGVSTLREQPQLICAKSLSPQRGTFARDVRGET
jgi:hypothetical protein